MAKTTDELFAEATEADYETIAPVVLAASDTEEEFQFRIDEHLRTIAIPEKGVVAGVEGDLNVNIARFTMVRYYHGRDLSKLSIRINYRNANGQVNYYNVSDAVVSGDSIVFSWEYAADVTQYKGNVQFVVYLFSATNAVLKQRFFTTLGTLEVLEGLEVDSSIPVSEQTDILLHLKKDLSAYAEEVKKSLPADYTAMTEQVNSLKEEFDNLGAFRRYTCNTTIAIDNVQISADKSIIFRTVSVPEDYVGLIVYGMYGKTNKDGYDKLISNARVGNIVRLSAKRSYDHIQVCTNPYGGSGFSFDMVYVDSYGIAEDVQAVAEDVQAVATIISNVAAKTINMKININTINKKVEIYINSRTVIFGNNYYILRIGELVGQEKVELDYSESIEKGATLVFEYDATQKIFLFETMTEASFSSAFSNKIVLFTAYLSALGRVITIVNSSGNLYIDGTAYKDQTEVAELHAEIAELQTGIDSGHCKMAAGGVVKQWTNVMEGERYKIFVRNNSDAKKSNPIIYLLRADGSYISMNNTAYKKDTDSYSAWDVTIPEGFTTLRIYANIASGADYIEFDWSVVRIENKRIDLIEGRLDTAEKALSAVDIRSYLNRHTAKIFKKVVCCGDSYTSGHIKLNGETSARTTNENFAWPHYMSTATGNEWINCGCSGCNVLTWQTHGRGLPTAQSKGKAQAYVIGLMINDVSNSDRAVELGSIDDIGTDNKTYYGGMSKIIRELNAISPKAKIFINTCPKTGSKYTEYNQAVRNIVQAYKETYPVHCIDLEEVQELYTNVSLTGDSVSGHYTAIGYEQFAEIYEYVLSNYINTHISEFQNVHEIEYD